MQTLFYPGYRNEPAQIDYGISTSDTGVNVVAVHSRRLGLTAASLIARDESRDFVLNWILTRDLAGLRIDCIRFHVLIDSKELEKTLGFDFPIELDFEDYRRKGNRYSVSRPIPKNWRGRFAWALGFRPPVYETRNEDVVANCARFYTPFACRRHLTAKETARLAYSIGHVPLGKTLPTWLTDSVSITD